MSIYTIQPGKHDWKPVDGIGLPFQSYRRRWRIRFDPSCWYDTRTVGDHWNKGKGFYNFFQFRKDRNNFMWVWRPGALPDTIEVTWYANDDQGGWTAGPECIVKANEWVDIEIWKTVRKCTFDVFDTITGVTLMSGDYYLKKDYKFYGEIGLYFGGNPAAPHAMEIEVVRVPTSVNQIHKL